MRLTITPTNKKFIKRELLGPSGIQYLANNQTTETTVIYTVRFLVIRFCLLYSVINQAIPKANKVKPPHKLIHIATNNPPTISSVLSTIPLVFFLMLILKTK